MSKPTITIEEILRKEPSEASNALAGLGFTDGGKALKALSSLSSGPLKDLLEELVELSLGSASPCEALVNMERVLGAVDREVLKVFLSDRQNLKNLALLCGASPYLSNMLAQNPAWFEELFIGGALGRKKGLEEFAEELKERTSGVADFDGMSRALRRYRNREYIRIGLRDLLRLDGLRGVTAELSDLACASLEAGLEFCKAELVGRYGRPLCSDRGEEREAGFSVIGLGKLGGRELNFSSDIDVLYIYSTEKGETTGVEGKEHTRIPLHVFFKKLAERLTRLISSVTEDGFVFRVDLDLRPEGRNGELVNSLRSAEVYYESWGQTWERSAMIKARPVAGCKELGKRFIKMIGPFVYRRYLDFTAIEEIKAMKERIDLERLRRRPDTIDVKLGAGGIREIEFFCQVLQLIYGGRNPALRERNTLRTIERLCEEGLLKEADAEVLEGGYVFLRNLEHRIQIIDGRQTHAVPAKPEELERLARMMGFTDREGRGAAEWFWQAYRDLTGKVHGIYRTLFYSPSDVIEKGVPEDVALVLSREVPDEEACAMLKGLGFVHTTAALRCARLLRDGPAHLRLPSRARALRERLAPYLVAKAARTADPDMALANMERFTAAMGARTGLYALLAENPGLTEQLLRIFGASAFLANSLIEHPENLDILLDKEMSRPVKAREEQLSELREQLGGAADYEEKLEALRRYRNQEFLRIGINDILGSLPAEEVSSQLTSLAEAAIDVALDMALEALIHRYGRPGDERFFVVGMGKLGGREMIYGSDLDIFFIYSERGEKQETTGPRVISNHEFYVRLAQRIISILSLRTKGGIVFTVDTRLRPSGTSGPLVVSKTSFLRYHRERATVWERQAALKARVVAGRRAFGEEVLEELSGIIHSRPLAAEEVEELLRIRKRMEDEIAREGPQRIDIKTGKGGLVDIEFLVQALQLRFGGSRPALRTPHTLTALNRLLELGIISEDDHAFLVETYRFYRLLETRLRIMHDTAACVLRPGDEALRGVARRAGYGGERPEEGLLTDYMARSKRTREIYLKIMEGLKGTPSPRPGGRST